MRRCGWLIPLLLLGWTVLAAVPALVADPVPLEKQIKQSNGDLEQTRDRIQAHRDRISSLTNQERDTSKELEDLVHEIDLVRTLLAGLDEREKILQQQSDTLRVQLADFQSRYQKRRTALGQRLRTAFVHGTHRNLELILTADSFSSLVTRIKFAAIMARMDGALVEQARGDTRRLQEAQSQLKGALAGIWEAREEASRERQRFDLMEEERRAVLESVKRDRTDAERSLARLKQSEQNLRGLLAKLERQRQAGHNPDEGWGGSLAEVAGKLDWPVAGEVTRRFGRSVHPEFKTVTLNNGINIAAPVGTPVYAVASGRVEFVDDLPGFGLCVILDHGAGYYTLYAYLARSFVTRGQPVQRNSVLAEVGRMENGGGSQLYFEIRQGKRPLDPLLWLKPRG